MDPAGILASLVIGLAAGTASGLLGVGGGIILVPAIMLGLGHPFLEAKAESLFVIMGTSFVGAYTHDGYGNVDLKLGAILGGSGILGAGAGYLASTFTPTPIFMTAFGALMGVVAVQLWMNGDLLPEEATRSPSLAVIVPLGITAGFVSAFFGIGGGILFVPIMVVVGIPMHLAVGTSLVGVFVNGASGFAVHTAAVAFDPIFAVTVLVGALIGVRIGAKFANRVDAGKLKRVFAVGLAAAGLYMALQPWFL